MIEKNISSRFVNKHDIEENWKKAVNFIPKQSELIVYDVDANHDYERLKVGDGVNYVNDLPFISVSEVELASIKNQINQNKFQVSETKPDFACIWFRVTSKD